MVHLRSNADDTASGASTSVAGLLGLLVAATAEVVSTGVNNKGTAKDALGTDQFDELVLLGANGVALGIGLEVTKVTDVTDLILGGTVGFAEGVEVGPSRGAAVGVVTELVDVEATLSVGIVAGDVP